MRHRRVIVVVGTLLAGLSLRAHPALALSASYKQTITTGQDVMVSDVLMKDTRCRIEARTGGQTMIIIRNAQGTYNYLPGEKMAMKVPALGLSQQPVEHLDDYVDYLKQRQAVLLRSETMNGAACDVYQFSDPSQGGAITAWVAKDNQFPVRVQIEGASGLTTVDLSDIRLDAPIQDAMFELPAGTQIMDVGPIKGLENLTNDGE